MPVIAGPCSAESREQVLAIAAALSALPQIIAMRSGIWKPRTRPDEFEGVGEKGLEWLNEAKQKYNIKIAVEIANTTHIDLCMKHNVDFLWLGARTVGNPFSVQEIAESLKGTNACVMVKNPLNPDIKLWIGALERMNNAGISKLIAVHRGFYCYENPCYRNSPMWEIPIELKRLFPELPLFIDPSHIAGKREYIKRLTQYAVNLDMDGLMVEVHHRPEQALTDASQQITPDELKNILFDIVTRTASDHKILHQNEIETLRSKIDHFDNELIETLAQRMDVVREIGLVKKEHDITVLQLKRWIDIIQDRLHKAENSGLNKDFLKKLLEIIHKEAIRIQSDILDE